MMFSIWLALIFIAIQTRVAPVLSSPSIDSPAKNDFDECIDSRHHARWCRLPLEYCVILRVMRETFCPKTCGLCSNGVRKQYWDDACPPKPTTNSAHLARDISKFGWHLLERFIKNEAAGKNVVISPTSIAFALEMILYGAPEHQKWPRLNSAAPTGQNVGAYQKLSAQLSKREQKLRLSIANSLFLHNDFVAKPGYIKMIANCLSAHLVLKDFRKNSYLTAKEINKWVARETYGMIPRLLEESSISSSTVLLLANVLYFNGKWKIPFVRENGAETSMLPFMSANGQISNVPTMVMQSEFLFAEDGHTALVGIPYVNDEAVLFIILPKAGHNWSKFMTYFAFDSAEKLMGSAKPEEMKLSIPKFDLKQGLSLKSALGEMGMSDLFDPQRANFSGMIYPNIASPLYITDAVHTAAIRVHEKGTEAAAATGIGASFYTLPEQRRFLAVDRPFLFVLRHEATKTPLFIGQVVDLL